MRALLQRVTRGEVRIDGDVVGKIGRGLVLLLGIHREDTADDVDFLAKKCANLRIFQDEDGRFNRSILEVGGAVLLVSQFTLYADCRRGRRPSFSHAAAPELAIPLYEHFTAALIRQGLTVATGRFGADMQVDLCNDGPVTVMVESKTGGFK